MGTRISSQYYLRLVCNYAAYVLIMPLALITCPEMATPSHVIFPTTVLLSCVLSSQFFRPCVFIIARATEGWCWQEYLPSVRPPSDRTGKEERVAVLALPSLRGRSHAMSTGPVATLAACVRRNRGECAASAGRQRVTATAKGATAGS